jgi:hypothetical protein
MKQLPLWRGHCQLNCTPSLGVCFVSGLVFSFEFRLLTVRAVSHWLLAAIAFPNTGSPGVSERRVNSGQWDLPAQKRRRLFAVRPLPPDPFLCSSPSRCGLRRDVSGIG